MLLVSVSYQAEIWLAATSSTDSNQDSDAYTPLWSRTKDIGTITLSYVDGKYHITNIAHQA